MSGSLGTAPFHVLPRGVVRTVACPRCGARPGHFCFRVNGKTRTSNHIERVREAHIDHGLPLPHGRGR